MANPQKEHGYVGVANTIWDALCRIRIPGEARQVLDVVIRETYGWRTKTAMISLDNFALSTGLRKCDIIRAIKKLYQMNLISKKANGEYHFNKDFDLWKPLAKKQIISEKANLPLAKKQMPTLLNHIYKNKHLEFVYLTTEEHTKLQERFGALLPEKIETLNNYIGSRGRKYHSHYHTILSWAKKDEKKTPSRSGMKTQEELKKLEEMELRRMASLK